MTMDALIANIPLDSKRFNRGRIAWEASVGAGYSHSLDASVCHARLLEIAEACKVAADFIARTNKIANQTDEGMRLS